MRQSTEILNILSPALDTIEILHLVKMSDMDGLVHRLLDDVRRSIYRLSGVTRNVETMKRVNRHSQSLNLFTNEHGSINVTRLHRGECAERLYATTGKSIFFSIKNTSFSINKFNIDNNKLSNEQTLTVSRDTPQIINHDNEVYFYNLSPDNNADLAFNIHLKGKMSDIRVFDLDSKENIAWLPADERVTKSLIALEALNSLGDPGTQSVCEELIYHHHPAVCWKAFQILHRLDKKSAHTFIPIIKSHDDEKLSSLIEQHINGWNHAIK
ncbi:hypothetical protein [Burkholderia ubonensis]|uniref:hypothetical protein n=1 Tax=Burkholderia ubonensis TaxID=101571 RepID=UPI000A57479B|nr:hypothetical protein [Burkholderia ubonensis]